MQDIASQNLKPTKDQARIISAIIKRATINFLVGGKPGVGKSVLIKALEEALLNLGRSYALAAPTGLAALNIGGRTLHSIFRLPVSDGVLEPDFNNFNMDDRIVNNIRYNIKHLIIDEISMVRADVFDFMDRMMRSVKQVDKPFGGVQIIAVGDFYQLPPVVFGAEKKRMQELGYASPFIFDSRVFQTGFETLTLTEVLRQKGDTKFLDLLDRARTGDLNYKDAALLNKCVGQPKDIRISLTGTNKQSDEINGGHLRAIPGDHVRYEGAKFGEWPALPAQEVLDLKVGAQVMCKQNGADRPPHLEGPFISTIVNGTLGRVVAMEPDKVVIELRSGEQTSIYKRRWERSRKVREGDKWVEEVIASYEQMPLALAWAISIHKSQGQSFDAVHIDAAKIFAPGQMYVALSRVRSLKGLSLEADINIRKFYADPHVTRFFESVEV